MYNDIQKHSDMYYDWGGPVRWERDITESIAMAAL